MSRNSEQELAKENFFVSLFKRNLSKEFLNMASSIKNCAVELNRESISLSYFEAFNLSQIVEMNQCTHFIELGSLTGFSALFILLGLKEGGTIYCFEKNEKVAAILVNNLKLISKVPEFKNKKFHVLVGDAILELEKLNFSENLDGVFIDANKSAYLKYLQWSEKTLKSGGIIIADNVYLRGAIWGELTEVFSTKQIEVMRKFNETLINHKNFNTFVLNSSDGMIVARKK